MLTFTDFCSEIAGLTEARLAEGYAAQVRTVRKNNNVQMEGLLIRYREEEIVPTIYLDPFYEQYCEGRLAEHIADEILAVYRENRFPWKEMPKFDFAGVKDRIQFRMMNRRLNEDALENMPHVEIGDLAVGFQWTIDTDDSRVGTVQVTRDQVVAWGVSEEELTELAMHNTEKNSPPVLRSIEDVLLDILSADHAKDISGDSEEERERLRESLQEESARREFPMYVLSNGRSHIGASALLSLPFLKRFEEKIGEDFWILPSSIHEVILVPVSKMPDRDKLIAMVKEINRTQVPPQEFLSDEVYCFHEFENLMPAPFREKLAVAG